MRTWGELREARYELTARWLIEFADVHAGNFSAGCLAVGIERTYLHRLMCEYGIAPPPAPPGSRRWKVRVGKGVQHE